MLKFSYFAESADSPKTSKNVHLTHIEDLLLDNGLQGGLQAAEYLSAIADLISGSGSSDVNLSTKFDGSPALVLGKNPESGKFFVSTKSVFNKIPKFIESKDQIQTAFPDSPELQEILGTVFDVYSKKPIDGVYQGDLMFTHTSLKPQDIDGEKYLTYTPNTITYAVPEDSELAKDISKKKVGIAFHTKYRGETMSGLTRQAFTSPKDFDEVNDVPNAYSFPTQMDVSNSLLSSEESEQINTEIQQFLTNLDTLGKNIDKYSHLSETLNTYINSEIRKGNASPTYRGYCEYYREKKLKEIDKLKTETKKQEKRDLLDADMGNLEAHRESLESLFELHGTASKIKLRLLSKINQIQKEKLFVKTDTGFKVTNPEGYVAVRTSDGASVKLIDRLEFSKDNFNMSKAWKSDPVKADKSTQSALKQFSDIANKKKSIVVTFGRFNPPTKGHEALVNRIHDIAAAEGGSDVKVFLSQSTGNKKNPLNYSEKIRLAQTAFPKANIAEESSVKTPMHIFEWLRNQGYENVRFVVGRDRMAEFETAFMPYVKDYGFADFKFVDYGERLADEGDKDISATRARKLASQGKIEELADILPTNLRNQASNIASLVSERLADVAEQNAEKKSKGKKQKDQPNKPKPAIDMDQRFDSVVKKQPEEVDLSGSITGLSYVSGNTAKKSIQKITSSGVPVQRKIGIAKRQYNLAKTAFDKELDPKKKVKFHQAAQTYLAYLKSLSNSTKTKAIVEAKEVYSTEPITVVCLTSSKSSLSDTVDKIQKACEKKKVTFFPVLTQYAYIDDLKVTSTELTVENYDGTGKSFTINPKNAVCFVRGGVMNTFIGKAILKIFENAGTFVINDTTAMELCANKLATSIELDRNGIRTPKTAFVANETSIERCHEKIGKKFPVVIKTLTGAEGIGVCIVNTPESLKSVLQSLWKYKAEVIIQEYLEIKNDVRTLVLDGKVIAAAKRDKATDDFRTNLALGAKGGPYQLSKEEIEITEKAAKALGCYYVGVDHVISNGKPYIIELNASPGSGNVYHSYLSSGNITGQELIDTIVEYVLDRSHWRLSGVESGLYETIEIEEIGSLSAKLDTGNDSYNVLGATDITEANNQVTFKIPSTGKQYTKPVVSHVRVRTNSATVERRPVVELDVLFRNRKFASVRFSLADRANNKYPVLLGLKFVRDAKLSVNVNKEFALESTLDRGFGALVDVMEQNEAPLTLEQKMQKYMQNSNRKIRSILESVQPGNAVRIHRAIEKLENVPEAAAAVRTLSEQYAQISNDVMDKEFSIDLQKFVSENTEYAGILTESETNRYLNQRARELSNKTRWSFTAKMEN